MRDRLVKIDRLYATGPLGLECPHGCKSQREVSDDKGTVLMRTIIHLGK